MTRKFGSPKPKDGRRMTTEELRLEFQRMSRDLGFRVNCTITRHTRATELRRRGWDLLALQHYLGHANISSTAVYAAVTSEDLQDLMRRHGSRDPWTSTDRWAKPSHRHHPQEDKP